MIPYYFIVPDNVPQWVICTLSGILVVGIGTTVGVIVYDSNQKKESMEELNTKIERDLDVDSFSAQNVIFNKTNENFVIRIAGSSKETSYLTADYKVSEQDFYDIMPTQSEFAKVDKESFRFIEKLLDILYRSEFLGKDEELALINDGELVLNLSKPYVNKETNSMNFDITIAKLHGGDLKLGTYVVSTPLDEQLIENPNLIYSMSSEKVEILEVDTKTHRDVSQVDMYDDCTLVF